MHKPFLLISSLLFVLSACNGDPAPIKGADFSGKNYRETTNTQTCSGAPSITSPYNRTWMRTFVSDTDSVKLKYQFFENNLTRVTQTCEFPSGASLDVTMDVASLMLLGSNGRYTYAMTEEKQNVATTTFNGNNYSCTVSVKAFNLVPVIFAGGCLGLVADAKATYYVALP